MWCKRARALTSRQGPLMERAGHLCSIVGARFVWGASTASWGRRRSAPVATVVGGRGRYAAAAVASTGALVAQLVLLPTPGGPPPGATARRHLVADGASPRGGGGAPAASQEDLGSACGGARCRTDLRFARGGPEAWLLSRRLRSCQACWPSGIVFHLGDPTNVDLNIASSIARLRQNL